MFMCVCVHVYINTVWGRGWIHQWTHTSPELFWVEGFLLNYSQTQGSPNLWRTSWWNFFHQFQKVVLFGQLDHLSHHDLRKHEVTQSLECSVFSLLSSFQSWYCLFAFSFYFLLAISFNDFKLTKYELLVLLGFI